MVYSRQRRDTAVLKDLVVPLRGKVISVMYYFCRDLATYHLSHRAWGKAILRAFPFLLFAFPSTAPSCSQMAHHQASIAHIRGKGGRVVEGATPLRLDQRECTAAPRIVRT